jgi:hypothetical protein
MINRTYLADLEEEARAWARETLGPYPVKDLSMQTIYERAAYHAHMHWWINKHL